jgi:DNA invertase Pin-like site-specific DNA recombinase
MNEYVIAKYIRLSLDDAQTDSMSIKNQRLLLDAHIAELDIPNTRVIERVDNGYSGTNFERPGVQELLELVRAGEVNCVLVKDFSRFGRNAIETGYFIERVFPLFGLRFISVTDGYDSDNYVGDTGGLEVSFCFLKHEYYSRDLSRKIKSARREKMRRGESVKKDCRFGYGLDEKRRMIIDEPAADTVRLIFKLMRNGSSLAKIAKRLYEDKRPTPREHKRRATDPLCVWDVGTIGQILRDEQYTGMYVAGKTRMGDFGSGKQIAVHESEWIKIPNQHPAIIDKPLFDAVRAVIDAKGESVCKRMVGTTQRYKGISSPLKGLVVCGSCGHIMTLTQTANPRFVCHFTRNAADAECHRLRVEAKELEDSLFGIIRKQTLTVCNISDSTDLIDRKSGLQSECEKRTERLNDEKQRLYEQFVIGEIGADDYKTAKIPLDAEFARLTRTGTVLAEEAKKLAEMKAINEERRSIAELVACENTLTRPFAEALIDRVLVYPGERIKIEWKFADRFDNNTEELKNAK